nr:Uma2 family endonuclease [Thioalkalivibrio sp.]
MAEAAPRIRMTHEAFLRWEETQEIRHEFLEGEVFAVTGGTDRHNMVSGNIYMLLRQHLHGKPCRVFMADVQVRVEAADAAFYPDVMVTCAPEDAEDRRVKRHPSLIVEALSPATASFDIGRKFTCYRQIESLREYVLVDPDEMGIEIFRPDPDGRWVLYSVRPGERLRLDSVGLDVPIEAVYENID